MDPWEVTGNEGNQRWEWHATIKLGHCDDSTTVRSIKIWPITQFIILARYTTTMDLKWNKMCFKCRLSALIRGYLHPDQVNGAGVTTHFILFPPFWGTKGIWTVGCSAAPCPAVCSSLIISSHHCWALSCLLLLYVSRASTITCALINEALRRGPVQEVLW